MAGREAMNLAAQLGDPAGGRMAAQLPEVLFMAAGRDEPEDDAEAFRRYAFLFILLVACSLIYVVGNPSCSSSFAAEDVLTLFLFWNILLVVFLASFVPRLHPVAARIAALIADALRTYMFANRALLLFLVPIMKRRLD